VSIAASISAPSLTLDQLAALSQEIAALARAGVPLDRGLRELGRELPGRLGKLAAEMSGGLAEGKALCLPRSKTSPARPASSASSAVRSACRFFIPWLCCPSPGCLG
jgi:hypothetical protein